MSLSPVHQYLLFLFNVGKLGLLSWVPQYGIYWLMNGSSYWHCTKASFLACVPLVFVNLSIQRRLIFTTNGPLLRFLLEKLLIMASISLFSPLCRAIIELVATRSMATTRGFLLLQSSGSSSHSCPTSSGCSAEDFRQHVLLGFVNDEQP